MKKITPAAILRARALDALKATWTTVLPLVAVIQLATYVLSQLVGLIPGVADTILSFVAIAVLMVPSVGVLSGVLGYFRGKPLTWDCIESMMPHALKIIGLHLWTMLCLMGWFMLGAIPMFIGIPMLPMELWSQGSDMVIILGFVLVLSGFVLMLILGFRAAFSYSMYTCILIDAPATPVRDILKKSKAMMQGYRWHYVKVSLPVFIILFAVIFVIGALTAALPAWLASLISSVMAIFTSMFSYYFLPVMYEELRRIGR